MDPNQNPFAGYMNGAGAAPATAPPPAPAAPAWGAPAAAPAAPAWGAPAAAAPAAPAPAAPAPAPAAQAGVPAGFGGPSLEWNGNVDDPNAKVVRLRDRLNEADTERRKDKEAAEARERAAEIRREERLRKIKYMEEMPDSTQAGTGMCWCWCLCSNRRVSLILFCCCSGRVYVQRRCAGSIGQVGQRVGGTCPGEETSKGDCCIAGARQNAT